MTLPEVRLSLGNYNLTYRQSTNKQPDTKLVKFSLNLQLMTVRQVLHAIAKASGTQFWILRKSVGRLSVFSISTSPALQ
jgi:hypothetical protein